MTRHLAHLSILLLTAASISAKPIKQMDAFRLLCINSALPKIDVEIIDIQAVNGYLTISRTNKPTTSCPTSVKYCPTGNTTAVITSGRQAALDAEIPGGQYLYVDEQGKVAYSAPGAGIIPQNATARGFERTEKGQWELFGRLGFERDSAMGKSTGFMACPQEAFAPAYNVMVHFEGFINPEQSTGLACHNITIATTLVESEDKSAWQYDV